MNKLISITVVIPCYNSVKTIEKCINSILNQSVKVDEIIVIDDGSVDGTVALVKNIFITNFHETKNILIEQENSGPSVARNKGVNASNSNYIAFLDSDDQWFVDHIKVVKEFLISDSNYDIIATKYQSAPTNYYGEVGFKQLLLRNYFLTPSVVVKKASFNNVLGFNEDMHYAEDYFLWLNLTYNGRGYLLPYLGAGNIENKKPFGDKGLSSNLEQMHSGVLFCYKSLLREKKISTIRHLILVFREKIKYLRRCLLSN